MLIFFYGQDDYRISDKLKSIKDRFTKTIDPKSLSIEELEAENIEYNEFREKIGKSSLFTKKRLLIIHNIFSNKKIQDLDSFISLLKKYKNEEANVICFVEKSFDAKRLNLKQKKLFNFLSQEKFSQEFKLLNNSQLLNYAKEKFAKQKISDSAIRLLVSKTGPDLWKLNNEINKIVSLKKDQLSDVDIEELVIGQNEDYIFALCDAIAGQDKKQSFTLLNQEIEKQTSLEYILSMLIRQFKILIEVKSDNNRSTASQMNLHPYVLSKSKNQISFYKLTDLINQFDKLINIEYAYKQGKIDLKKALLALVL